MAEVFKGIGFKVELTRPSKDQGRDIILTVRLAGQVHSYLVELKHWLSDTRVGEKPIRQFLNIVVKEERTGGLFLSTLGYTRNAFETLTEIERNKLKFGNKWKIASLCRTFEKSRAGLIIPKELLLKVLFDDTI